jgi:hypothetical protein
MIAIPTTSGTAQSPGFSAISGMIRTAPNAKNAV